MDIRDTPKRIRQYDVKRVSDVALQFKSHVLIKGTDKTFPVHDMKAYKGSWVIDPLILYVGKNLK